MVRQHLEQHLREPFLYKSMGVQAPIGVLITGPPGVGKKVIARALANETGASIFYMDGIEITSMTTRYAEDCLQRLFETAERCWSAVIFIENVDCIAPRNDKGICQNPVASVLLKLVHSLKYATVVVATSTKPQGIDQELRVRFDASIELRLPDVTGRLDILRIATRTTTLLSCVDLTQVSLATQGWSGSALTLLCSRAVRNHVTVRGSQFRSGADWSNVEFVRSLAVTQKDFQTALETFQQNDVQTWDVTVEAPKASTEEIGGLESVKQEITDAIMNPITQSEAYAKFGLASSKGALLYGPPGCGKTLMLKSITSDSNINFINIPCSELISIKPGESEARVRSVFQKGRAATPCVLAFDEIDTIAKQRNNDSNPTDNIVNQLLVELDGVETGSDVFAIGTTNRPNLIDRALLRPGRIEQLIFIPLPDEAARRSIFASKLKNSPVAENIDATDLAKKTEGFSGADIGWICQRASRLAFNDYLRALKTRPTQQQDKGDPIPVVQQNHFDQALKDAKPSVTAEEVAQYKHFAETTRIG